LETDERYRDELNQIEKDEFFLDMEANILASLKRGELVPSVPLEETSDEGPPLEPIPTRVRTISGMNEHLLSEIHRSDQSLTEQKGVMVGRPPLPQRRPSTNTSKPPKAPVSMPLPPQRTSVVPRESNCLSPVLQGEHLLDGPILSDSDSIALKSEKTDEKAEVARPPAIHQRRNTGGTIFVKSTMENPDIKATIKCVCGVYRAHIVASQPPTKSAPPKHMKGLNLKTFSDDRSQPSSIPSLTEIEQFYAKFFEKSQMEHDTIIMSLIYVERLIKESNGILSPTKSTWASILFSCMILASKVWDDLSMWNVDFSNVSFSSGMPPYSLQRINQLEVTVLTCLHFNVTVLASEYAKYYFLIRTMLARSGFLEHAQSPLNRNGAKQLEARTTQYQEEKLKLRSRTRSFDVNGCGDRVCIEQLVSMDR